MVGRSESDSTKLLASWGLLCIFFCVCVKSSSFQVSASFASVAAEDHNEANALLKWKASLVKQSQDTLSSWNGTGSPCKNWKGISCDESMSVSMINLTNLGLRGKLHNLNFASFPNLHILDISHNMFYGNIPPQIGNLSNIFTLKLFNNFLRGPIPREIGALSTLNLLDIGTCNLTEPIPQEIGNLRNLTYLILKTNRLSGSIPKEIGMLNSLLQLDLSENPLLSGRIPSSIGNLSKLQGLYLYNMSLSGPIPNEIRNLYSLTDLQFINNNLHGPIPPFIGNFTNLTTLELGNNKLFGSIPVSIGNLVNLGILGLGNNNLSGHVPSTIGNLTKLKELVLFTNNLTGLIPPEISNLTNLFNLQLGENDFIGHLPQVCLGQSLEIFGVDTNHFSGPIPRSLKDCSSLYRLRLDNNQLVDNIADAFGVHSNLNYIDLSGNKLYGHLSSKWGKCGNLTSLKIANNNLSGGIPPQLGEATKLGELNLSSNHLRGEIPKELGKLTSLIKLSLSHNQFSGNIPIEIGSLSRLEQLELEANNLSGSIIKDLGQFSNLWLLNLSSNKFEESIPSEFGQLRALRNLDLSRNLLTGTIPTTLGDLESLMTLNLSHNNLSGVIPSSFNEMSGLSSIDISYNQLEGSLPNNPAFRNITFQALRNNKGLCGNVTDLCNKSNNHAHGHKSKKVKLLVLCLTLSTLILILVVGGVMCIFCPSVQKTENQDSKEQAQDLYFVWSSEREIMYENITEATKDFDDKYLIGKGGQGNVYKAELPTGEVVAVKKLHSMPDGEILNLKAFTSEVRALTEIKHRNIVKLYGFFSNSQFSFLVYEFLEGGSLDNILKNEKHATKLNWNKRMNVVKGVANALFHMHHGCSYPIVHRDISSKNVLLDSEYEEAHITDFGTTKFLKPNSKNMTAFAGTFGYAAPEIAYIMEANEKCDVYSFGVLTLEIIMGMHPGEFISSLAETSTTYDLPLKNLLDPRLPLPTKPLVEDVMLIAKLAFACLSENPRSRPTMEQVSMELEMPKYHLADKFATITIRQLMKVELIK